MRGEKKADIDVYKPSCGHRDMEYWTEHVILRERDKRHGNGAHCEWKRTEVDMGRDIWEMRGDECLWKMGLCNRAM